MLKSSSFLFNCSLSSNNNIIITTIGTANKTPKNHIIIPQKIIPINIKLALTHNALFIKIGKKTFDKIIFKTT
ncbi:MAG: hypothetical protein BWY04_00867 [candidate division CPR1 bacterium ADurb.Bin160]|uniref:Uncharacterized protein n=1 Tax=candidate division CPR1 bacterium ADurb.Bin160 TaxID=1852826 RepID=A0A1V5ZMA5_9BACT|nr:MAG: hypothetical protein BWY04_00867 [candidate division CPR1 bacterium ADurb.Bin160]